MKKKDKIELFLEDDTLSIEIIIHLTEHKPQNQEHQG